MSQAQLAAPASTVRPPIISRALLLRFVSVVGSSIGFFLPLAAVPLYADAAGTRATAGLATGGLLVATVLGEVATPGIVARVGYRAALAVGLILLGAPALALLATPSLALVLTVSIVRGIGFAVCVVAGGALTAALIPSARRGEGLAIVGVVNGIPTILALPAGVWAADRWGFPVVFVVAALAPLAALVTLPGLPARHAPGGRRDTVLIGLRDGALMRPATIFAASASAAGVMVTYLPMAVHQRAAWLAPAALLIHPAAATVTKLVCGRHGDRCGQAGLLAPGTVLSIAGMAALALTGSPFAVLAGAAVLGSGFGLLQNATQALMYARVPESRYSTVSAIWNAAYDLGMAIGALGIGLIVSGVGFTAAFLITGAIMLPTLVMAHREHAGSRDAVTNGTAAQHRVFH
jgi:predicted MFS family arabinose efflux permease